MKTVTAQQMRELDRRTMEEAGVPGECLMERAGSAVAHRVAWLTKLAHQPQAAHVVAGRGNNGGDAFVAALRLREEGFRVQVWLAGDIASVRGDARTWLDRLLAQGVAVTECPEERSWTRAFEAMQRQPGFLVDGILGTGTFGTPRGTAAAAIRCVNGLARFTPVVAIDIPSGLDADTGQAPGDAVVADWTVTFGFPKRGLVVPGYPGTVEVADIGIPAAYAETLTPDVELVAERDIRQALRRRPAQAHKGNLGHVLIVAGARGYAGAAGLAARAALRSGVGLVSVLTPACIADCVAGMAPEAMVHPGVNTDAGSLRADCLDIWKRHLDTFDAVLLGPGLTPRDDIRQLVDRALARVRSRLILDADALNVCAGRLEQTVGCASCAVVLTPHPGELARLLVCRTEDVQSDRLRAATRAATVARAVTVLKGAGTVIASPGRVPAVNMTGNPGMATGGMGDVLAGLVAGLLAQGMPPLEAAMTGVWLHGCAGDRAAWRRSQAGMIASDVIEEFPAVFRDVMGR